MLKVLHYYNPPTNNKLYVGRVDFMADKGTFRAVCSYGKATASTLSDHPKGEFRTYHEARACVEAVLQTKISEGYLEVKPRYPSNGVCFEDAIRKVDTSRVDHGGVTPLSEDLRRTSGANQSRPAAQSQPVPRRTKPAPAQPSQTPQAARTIRF